MIFEVISRELFQKFSNFRFKFICKQFSITSKAMKSSAILSVLLLFLSMDMISSNKHKEMCDIFKPGDVFRGIRAYKQALMQTNKMYAKGMEWEFVVTNKSIKLLYDTLASIQPNKTLLGWDQNDNQLVVHRKSIHYTWGWEELRECFVFIDIL